MDSHEPIITNEERQELLKRDGHSPARGNQMLLRMLLSSVQCFWQQVFRNFSGWVRSVIQ